MTTSPGNASSDTSQRLIDPFDSVETELVDMNKLVDESDMELDVALDAAFGAGPFAEDRPRSDPASEESRVMQPFGAGVGFAFVRPPTLGNFTLHPDEEALLGEKVHPRRRTGFLLGRAAAARALQIIGVDRVAIGRGSHGQPIWPGGIVGTISHTMRSHQTGDPARSAAAEAASAVARAAVARATVSAGLGIDVEMADRPMRPDVAQRVCLAEEKAWVEAPKDADDRRKRLLALFIAKEAVFKAFYPLREVFLGFADAKLHWDPQARAFDGELRRDASPDHPAGTTFRARILEVGMLLIAAVQLPPRA